MFCNWEDIMPDKKKPADEGLIDNDYCDLDPKKICDNCCKCIEKKDADYRGVKAEFDESTMRVYYAEEEDAMLADLPPMDIDPDLVEEWEKKLREAELADAGKNQADDEEDSAIYTKHDAAHIHGVRKKRG